MKSFRTHLEHLTYYFLSKSKQYRRCLELEKEIINLREENLKLTTYIRNLLNV